MALTEHGLEIKRQGEVIADLKSEAQTIFQDLVAPGDIVDTSDDSTIGRYIGLNSLAFADLWEAAQSVYLAFDPNSATGIPLDNIVAIGGIERFTELNTKADVYLTCNTDVSLNKNIQFKSSSTGMTYSLDEDVISGMSNAHGMNVSVGNIQSSTEYSIGYTSGADGQYSIVRVTSPVAPEDLDIYNLFIAEITSHHPLISASIVDGVLQVNTSANFQSFSWSVSINLVVESVIVISSVTATDVGTFEEPPGAINNISTPFFGLISVTNPVHASPGRKRETDEELRERFRTSKYQRATNIIESMYSSITGVTGIINVIIYENDTDVIDLNGLPPHSFRVIASGGIDTEIAKSIWLNKPAGITSVGNTVVNITDSFGYTRVINFSRPVDVIAYIRMTLVTDSDFPQDGAEQIKYAIEKYINTMNIGEDLVYSRLYTPINSVPGHEVTDLEVSTDGISWTKSNIVADIDETIVTTLANITIT